MWALHDIVRELPLDIHRVEMAAVAAILANDFDAPLLCQYLTSFVFGKLGAP